MHSDWIKSVSGHGAQLLPDLSPSLLGKGMTMSHYTNSTIAYTIPIPTNISTIYQFQLTYLPFTNLDILTFYQLMKPESMKTAPTFMS